MRRASLPYLLVSAVALLTAGCASEQYYAAAPPPPPPIYGRQPPLLEIARHEGFRAGEEEGARDAYEGRAYRPERHRSFHETPGYDPGLGPYGPYRDTFRDAYVHGYSNGYGGR